MGKKYLKHIFLILFALIMALSVLNTPGSTKYRELVFSDEFNGVSGSPVDEAKWTAEIGGRDWGNRELEYYTGTTENAYLDGNGSLVIKAIKQTLPLSNRCWYGPCRYTSARLTTKKKFELKYGRFEARIKIPRGQGVWPAFWLLGTDIDTASWPDCGEIDIMENIGREPSTVHGTIHGPGYSAENGISTAFNLEKDKSFADDFHVYAAEWQENEIRFYVDNNLYRTLTPKNLPPRKNWVFNHPFFMILNLAIGGNWGGKPNNTTHFPQSMQVDYVRVYK